MTMATAQQVQQAASTVPAIDLDEYIEAATTAFQQAVAGGRDTSGLKPEHRGALLNELARALRLNPLTKPVIFLKTGQGESIYVTRQGADQIAARLRLNRETVEGPDIRKVGNVDVAFCKVRVSAPDGRFETSTATLPAGDFAMVLMKVETKAKRRATLSLAGLGMLSEEDAEEMLDAALNNTPAEPEPTAAQNALALDLDDCTYNRDAVGIWLKHRDALTKDGDAARKAGWDYLVKHLMRLMETKKTAVERFLRDAIAEHDAAVRAALAPKVDIIDPPTATDYAAQLERCPSLDAVAELYRSARADLAKGTDADKAAAWGATLARLAVIMQATSTDGLGALLKRRIAELDAPKPPPPTGTDGPTRESSDPAAAIGATVAAANAQHGAAQASAEPRVVLDPAEAEARLLRADAVGDAAWCQRLVDYAAVFAMAGAFHKRAAAFREAGVLATRRAQTLDAIEAREQRGPEAARQALDGYATRRVMPRGYGEVIRMPQRPTATRTGTDG